MKTASLVALGGLLCLCTSLRADALKRSAGFTPTFSFSETRTERIVKRGSADAPQLRFPEVTALTRTELHLTASMDGQSLANIGPNTSLSLDLGELSLNFALADDPLYQPGDQQVFYPAAGWDDEGKPIGNEGLRVSWNAQSVTLTLTNSWDDDEESGPFLPAIALDFIGEQDGSIRTLSELNFQFGDAEGNTVCFVSGSASTRNESVSYGGISDQLSLTQVQLTAAIDVTAPVLGISGASVERASASNKTQGDGSTTQGARVLQGTAIDSRGLAQVRVKGPTIDGEESQWVAAELYAVTAPEIPDEWGRSQVRWTFPLGDEQRIGQQTYRVIAEDLAGNLSEEVSFSIVNELPDSLAGRWDSVVNDEDGNARGSLSLMVSKKGKVSGLFRSAKGQFPLVGDWLDLGISASFSMGPDRPAATLSASVPSLDFGELSDLELQGLIQVEGVEDQGLEALSFNFTASRSIYSARNPLPDDRVGRFHAAIQGTNELHEALAGESFLVIMTQKNGSASLVGQAADGTPWTWSGPVSAKGSLALIQWLYGKRGIIAGAINLDETSVWGEGLTWVRPAAVGKDSILAEGFSLDGLDIRGERYYPPAVGEMPLGLEALAAGESNTSLTLQGPDLYEPLNLEFNLGLSGRFSVATPNENNLLASLNRTSGLLNGSASLLRSNEVRSRAVLKGLVIGLEVKGFFIAAPVEAGGDRGFGSLIINEQSADQEDDSGDLDDWWWWWSYFLEISPEQDMPEYWPAQWQWWWWEFTTCRTCTNPDQPVEGNGRGTTRTERQ